MKRDRRRGVGLIEFVLTVMPLLFVSLSVLGAGMIGWQYSALAYSVEAATRYACTHGRTCTKNGNSCTITVADLANYLAAQTRALDSGRTNAVFASHAASVPCSPLSSCFTNTAQFPNSTDNGVGLDITITATYTVSNPLVMFWPGRASIIARNFTLGATSRQNIVF